MRKALWFALFSTTTVCCFIAIGVLSGYYSARIALKNQDYAIVLDAGSSGTRMYIYNWPAGFSASRGDNLIIRQEPACITDDNGIDKIRSADELASKFSNCTKYANDLIPADRKSRTYITLAATAGMRLLQLRNASLADTILGYIRDYFSQQSFLFKDPDQVRILSGQEEGSSGWISANYFEKVFKPQNDPLNNYGVLDLGGASTQIVYSPINPNFNYESFFDHIGIYGVNYKPYSNSYLCRGNSQASLMYRVYLMNKFNLTKQINASCYPINSTISMSAADVIDSPCTNGLMFGFSFNFTLNPSVLNRNDTYNFTGTSDSQTCENEVKDLLPSLPCSYSNCAFDNVYQPSVEDRTFYAFSGYYYTLNNTESLNGTKLNNNLNGYKTASESLCSNSIDDLRSLNNVTKSGISSNNLINLCFSNIYAIQLFQSYGFKDLSKVNIVLEVEGYTIGWTLGFLINELNRDDFLPYEEPARKISTTYFVPLVILSSLLVIVSIVLLAVFGCGLRCSFKETNL